MRVFLVNPSHVSFGTAVITPRWLYVLAAATPTRWGDPIVADETLDPFDAVTGGAGRCRRHRHPYRQRAARLRSRTARPRARRVGGVRRHSRDALSGRGARSRRRARRRPRRRRCRLGDGHRRLRRTERRSGFTRRDESAASTFKAARWDLLPTDRYMWASIQTVRGCPKHCSFCSVWRTDGQTPRQAAVRHVIQRGRGVAAARVPVHRARRRQLLPGHAGRSGAGRAPQRSVAPARARSDPRRALRPDGADWPCSPTTWSSSPRSPWRPRKIPRSCRPWRARGSAARSSAWRRSRREGLKDVHKGFNLVGEPLVERLQAFRSHGVHVLGSFIFGLPSDRPETFKATADLAERAGVTFAQFVMLTPYPGTVDFERWEREARRQRRDRRTASPSRVTGSSRRRIVRRSTRRTR